MRYMMFVKATRDTEAGVMPSDALISAMTRYNEELAKAGVLLDCAGLKPTSNGARIRFAGSRRTVIDGPFAETRELVAGYWLIEVASREEAIEWAKRCPATDNEVIEIRQVQEMSDFPADVQQAAAGFEDMQRRSGR